MSATLKLLLFVLVVLVPALLVPVTASVSFSRAERTEFCASCHAMTPWIEDVTSPDGDSLAADHYQHRWIQHDQCFTCHSDYSFLGPLEAKIKGMRHVVAYYIGERTEIALYEEFPNEQCLQCHRDAKGFREDDNHDPLEDILLGKDTCIECHEWTHDVEQEEVEPGSDWSPRSSASRTAERSEVSLKE